MILPKELYLSEESYDALQMVSRRRRLDSCTGAEPHDKPERILEMERMGGRSSQISDHGFSRGARNHHRGQFV